jgi:hypothetical protein
MNYLFLFFFLFSSSLFSQEIFGDIDFKPVDTEELVLEKGTDFFRADDIQTTIVRSDKLSLEIYIKKENLLTLVSPIKIDLKSRRGKEVLVADGQITEIKHCTQNPNGSFKIGHIINNKYFLIASRKTYELLFDLKCGEKTQLIFDYDSIGGQVMGILDIAQIAHSKLSKNNLLKFWTKKIKIKWPGQGDYYSYNTVNVTKGYQWDVVGHELGHAIYDQANIGAFGGGQHFIDRCYSNALALSEGWASLFSAWLKVGLKDDDAKFEYMVPRRAPLHFENIPEDVCSSHKNEWRVTGFLWDLIDLNRDIKDESELSFVSFWKFSENMNYRSAKSLAEGFVAKGFDPILMNVIWKQNFLTDF